MSVTIVAGLAAGAGQRFEGAADTIVVFREGLSQAQMMRAVLEARTNLKWTDKGGTIWVVDEVSWAGLITLHAEGAVLVSTTPVAAGCLAWSAVGATRNRVTKKLFAAAAAFLEAVEKMDLEA
ncbi:hypothetical protein CK222_31270 [Mesorhizobium sp. WSM3866]|nr:hypothetical protein CK222_31270 [Mesorhizobium sp. WSM3866]